jgi:hypothetical protein
MGRGDYFVRPRVARRVGSHDHSEVVERCHPNVAAIILAPLVPGPDARISIAGTLNP